MLVLKNDLFTYSVFINLIPLAIGIICCFTGGAGLALGILFIIGVLFRSFTILESITKVTINLSCKKLFIKHFFLAPIEIRFQEVININIEEVYVSRAITDYKLVALLSGGEEVILFNVPNEEDAKALKPKLLHLLS